ncbi:MAG: ribosome silencing factor [Bacteroidota bacterium]
MNQLPILRRAVAAVLAKKAADPVVLETGRLTPIADFFLICTGQTAVHVRAIADHLQDEMALAGLNLLRKEGAGDARWVLLDYGWLVVHLMQPRERDFYQLERLWHDAGRLDLDLDAEAAGGRVSP